jgi:cytochrome d ubiquinol oxidase subunit I
LFISAAISAVFVISANAWMNTPEGFKVINGQVTDVNPWDAMFNAAWLHEAIHGTIAAYVATGFAVAAVYAYRMLRGTAGPDAGAGIKLAMGLAMVAIVAQLVSGDFAARRVAHLQPEKFAAMESQYQTQDGAPLRIGGIPVDGKVYGAIEIPKMLSFLGYDDPNAQVRGLDSFPANDTPNETLVHLSFQSMVGFGFLMLGIAAWFWVVVWRRRGQPLMLGRWLLRGLVLSGFLGFAAVQAGWFVTEFRRQPWLVRGFLRTSEGVTDRPGIGIFFVLFTLVYIVVSVGLVWALITWPGHAVTPTADGGTDVS